MNIDYKFILPTVISSIAAVFAYLSYKRNRRFNNENHLFEKKIEAYSEILSELDKLIVMYENHLIDFQTIAKIHKKVNDDAIDELDNKADEIDNFTEKFVGLTISKSLLLPDQIINYLDKVQDLLFKSTIPSSAYLQYPESVNQMNNCIDKLMDLANVINDKMRYDLNIKKLNISLYKRLK